MSSDPSPQPKTGGGRWADLGPRLASGLALAGGGSALILLGGWWFAAMVIAAAGLMVMELTGMTLGRYGKRAWLMGLLAALSILAALAARAHWPSHGGGIGYWSWGWGGLFLFLPPLVAFAIPMERVGRWIFILYAFLVMEAAYGLVAFRYDQGALWLVWLVLLVVATDILGYFGGRLIGGPKFWPRVSPKKTWAGVLAGWLGAWITGWAFGLFTDAGPDLPLISVALSFASQLGDIAESAIKRRCGVKDSSNLIPGHGGLLDRFDGLLGAALVMLIVAQVVVVPVVRF